MRAGPLYDKIDILHLVSSRNEFGEQVDQYQKCCSTRAQIVHNSGNKNDVNHETDYTYTKTFVVRSYVPIKEFDRIGYKEHMWNVISIEDDRIMNNKTVVATIVNE